MIDLDIFGRGRIRELEYDKRELLRQLDALERTVRAQQTALIIKRSEINELTRKLAACRDILEHEHEKVQVLERMVLAGDKARKSLGDKLKVAEAECARLREAQHTAGAGLRDPGASDRDGRRRARHVELYPLHTQGAAARQRREDRPAG